MSGRIALAMFVAANFIAAPALSENLRGEDAVRLFLGMGNGSDIRAESIATEGADVVVKNLVLPIKSPGQADEPTPSKVPVVKVRELRFTGVTATESSAFFGGISGSGIMIAGDENVAARSIAFGPLTAKDLGTSAFSFEGDLNVKVADIVSASPGSTLRVSSYALSVKGDTAGKFTHSAKFDGIRSDQMKMLSPTEGFQVELNIDADGAARTMDGSLLLSQAQFGEVKSKFSLANTSPITDRMSLIVGQHLIAGEPRLKQASVSFTPSEQIKMLLMFTTSEQREAAIIAAGPLLRDTLGFPAAAATQAVGALKRFLSNPDRLSIEAAPVTPISLKEFNLGRSSGVGEDMTQSLGLKIMNGL